MPHVENRSDGHWLMRDQLIDIFRENQRQLDGNAVIFGALRFPLFGPVMNQYAPVKKGPVQPAVGYHSVAPLHRFIHADSIISIRNYSDQDQSTKENKSKIFR